MNNINQTIYNIYKNIHVFYSYRNLTSIDSLITNEELNASIQRNKYIILKAIHQDDIAEKKKVEEMILSKSKKIDTDVRVYYTIILYPNTDFDSKRSEFKKILNLVTYPKSDVFIISSSKIGTHMQKFINKLNEVQEEQKIYSYEYPLFKTIVPEYSLAPKYKILSKDEIKKQLESVYINIQSLPKILDTDPQMIWIGAKEGQVVQYEYLSEVTIYNIGYAIVIKE